MPDTDALVALLMRFQRGLAEKTGYTDIPLEITLPPRVFQQVAAAVMADRRCQPPGPDTPVRVLTMNTQTGPIMLREKLDTKPIEERLAKLSGAKWGLIALIAPDDADFYEGAPTDIAALLVEVKRLRAELSVPRRAENALYERLRTEVDFLREIKAKYDGLCK